jgi:hypothetical protein
MNLTIQGRRQISWLAVRNAVLGIVGRTMNLLHSPARLKEFEYVDPVSDQTVYLSTGARYSVLHIGSLKLFFDRATGKFDGTCRSLEERIESGLELFD